MKWFGIRFTDYDEEEDQVAVPVGQSCAHCYEMIERADSGVMMPSFDARHTHPWSEIAYHRECFLRGVLGSVAHQKKECSCFGGTGEDDPTLTSRQAAQMAVEYFYRHRGR